MSEVDPGEERASGASMAVPGIAVPSMTVPGIPVSGIAVSGVAVSGISVSGIAGLPTGAGGRSKGKRLLQISQSRRDSRPAAAATAAGLAASITRPLDLINLAGLV